LAEAPASTITGVDAITLGEPAVSTGRDDGDSDEADDVEEQTGVDAITVGQADGAEGSMPRKRKRRRRRGERKDRPAGDAGGAKPAEPAGMDEAATPTRTTTDAAPSSRPDVDHSPYAETPTAYISPASPAAPPSPSSPVTPPPAPPSSSEPSE
jgi:hypothetical protein